MARTAPQFPSLDAWEGMSEPEQDALLDRIEIARRRKLFWSRLQAGFAWGAVGVGLCCFLYLAVVVS